MFSDITSSSPRIVRLKKPSRFVRFSFLYLKPLLVVAVLGTVLFNTVYAPQSLVYATGEDGEDVEIAPASSAEERQQLEQQLLELEEEMAEQQKLIQQYRAQGNTLSSEINQINANIRKLNLQIEATELSLQKLGQDIYQTQQSINQTQNRIQQHKDALSSSLRSLYETDEQSLLAIMLQNDQISDFFNNITDMLLIQDNIRISLNDITQLRQELIEQKEELNMERQDVENLQLIRERQKSSLSYTQNQKEDLLEATQNKEAEYQNLLKETQKTAAEIRSRIFRLIGGGELTFETAYEYAKLAEGTTGVRAALTLAILDRESLLGKNVGGCSYQTAMHPNRDIPVFEVILEKLGIDPGSTVAKVSCPISAHGSYGGAMGPAQFIPSTWACFGGYVNSKTGTCAWGSGYTGSWSYNASKDYIGKIVGNTPSNPWSNADAFVATALYIEELYNSSSCVEYGNTYSHILPKQTLQERCAATKYYAGGNWWTYRFWYGDAVVSHADEFEQDIAILKS